MTYECPGCYGEYTSAWALAECERQHEDEDNRNREWVKTHPTGAVRKDIASE